MKKLIFTFVMILFTCQMSQAQNKNNLKGPKAKNYKNWQGNSQPTTVCTTANRLLVTGPNAKNQKIQIATSAEENKVVIKSDARKSKLKGPAAKNYKTGE